MWVLIISVMIQYQISLTVETTAVREYSYANNEAGCKAAANDPANNKVLYNQAPLKIAAHWESAKCVWK